jgi:uncharacterized protein (TIGR01777 family)
MRIFITGGTGIIGTRLVRRLQERQETIILLTRRPKAAEELFGAACTIVEGDPTQAGEWMNTAADCDAIVNLAGESIFGRRWNEQFKTLLHDSRIRSTEHIVKALTRDSRAAGGNRKVLVNASAIGYYGPCGDEELTEADSPGDDFLARICIDWEKAARHAEASGVRVAMVRIGVVLDGAAGALAKMLPPFKMGMGGPVGSGKQWVSWIHQTDIVGILLLAVDNNDLSGPLNGTAPSPVTNKELAKALGRVLHRPSLVPTPAFALRMMLGEVADVITTGQRVAPKKAVESGYEFRFPTVEKALDDLLCSRSS